MRARACLPTRNGHVASLRLLALVTLAPSSTAARVVGWPSVLNAQTRVVSTANWATKQGEAIHHHLKSSAIPGCDFRKHQVKVPQQHVGCHSTSSFTADATCHALQIPRTPARAHAARWPNESSGRPHRQVRTDKGRVPSQHLNHLGTHGCHCARAHPGEEDIPK